MIPEKYFSEPKSFLQKWELRKSLRHKITTVLLPLTKQRKICNETRPQNFGPQKADQRFPFTPAHVMELSPDLEPLNLDLSFSIYTSSETRKGSEL